MALPNLSPRTVSITGADCTGSDGETDRTYTFPESDITPNGMNVMVAGTTLAEGVSNDFTVSSNVITFLNAMWDSSAIRITYFVTYGDPTASTLSTTTTLKYATPLMLSEIIGVRKDIPSWDNSSSPTNEIVGLGDDSNTTFYLDQKAVIADSYTLYANAIEMTETTHYVLTADTGKIVLTAAGVTMLSTNTLTAEYSYYANGMKDSYIQAVLARAEKEVDNFTNTTYTDGSSTNPSYPCETEIQPSEGYFRDRYITKKKPLIDIESTLDGAITSSDTTISLASNTGGDNFPSTGNIVIGSEVISYTGVSGDDLTGCTRGALGTTAAAHNDLDAIHSTVFLFSNTNEGTDESFTVQPWDTSSYISSEGLIYRYKDASPSALVNQGVAKRVKIIYYYGHNTIPYDITRLTLLFAKRMLITDNIGKAMIAGRNEFRPEMLDADMEEIRRIKNSYVVFPMGNT